jgi:hypothetical protein
MLRILFVYVFIYGLYWYKLRSVDLENYLVSNESENVKGSGCSLTWGTLQAFAWRD